MNTTQTGEYAAQSASSRLAPFTIPRRAPRALDVAIEIYPDAVQNDDASCLRPGGQELEIVQVHVALEPFLAALKAVHTEQGRGSRSGRLRGVR